MLRREEDYKNRRLYYARTNFEDLMKYFCSIDWRGIMSDKTVQEKHEIFLRKYDEDGLKYIPKYKVRTNKHKWCNAKCVEAKRTKDRA